MSAAWTMYLLLVGGLMALAAELLATAMRALGRPTRWIWAGALAGVIILALVAPRQEIQQRQVAPMARTRATICSRFFSVRPGSIPRRPSLAPSARKKTSTGCFSTQSIRRTPPAEVSPLRPALTTRQGRRSASIFF